MYGNGWDGSRETRGRRRGIESQRTRVMGAYTINASAAIVKGRESAKACACKRMDNNHRQRHLLFQRDHIVKRFQRELKNVG